MNAFLIYILKVAVITAVFVLLYHLLFRRDTYFGTARTVLVASLVMSFILPFCTITVHRPMQETVRSDANEIISASAPVLETAPMQTLSSAQMQTYETPVAEGRQANWILVAVLIYAIGTVSLIAIRILSARKVLGIIRRGQVAAEMDGCKVVLAKDNVRPFSWMRYIVLPGNSADVSSSSPVICHEMAHIAHHHSMELLLTDILAAFQWFNPAVWLFRHDLASVQEFQADASVLESGHDRLQYEHTLLSMATGGMSIPLVNGMGESSLRARIKMMNRSLSSRTVLLKLIYLPVLIAVTLGLTSNKVYDRQKAPYVLTGGRVSLARICELPEDYSYQGMNFNIANGVAIITRMDWENRESFKGIPTSISINGKEYDVRVIAPLAFGGIEVTELEIPEGITEIGAAAFSNSNNLEKITIPSTVCMIESRAFSDCPNLKTVTFGNGLKTLADGAFLNCRNLESVQLPATLEEIGSGAFSDCRHLEKINMPKKLRRIGDEAFFRCVRLESFPLPKTLEYIGKGAFYDCRSMKAPDTSKLKAEIGENAFFNE